MNDGKGGEGGWGERAGKQIMNDSKNRRTEKHLPEYYRRTNTGDADKCYQILLGRSCCSLTCTVAKMQAQ